MKTTRFERFLARRACGNQYDTAYPVVVVDGDQAPERRGSTWHYRTTSGIPIDYPGAYSRRGWSNMVYHPSTHRIVVGREWLAAAVAREAARRRYGAVTQAVAV